MLGHYVVAHIAAAFALAGQYAHPVQPPVGVLFLVFGRVFHIVPYAVCGLEQLVAQHFGIAYGIAVAAQLQIPEVLARIGHVGYAVNKIIARELVRPLGRYKFARAVFLARLQHTAHAHGAAVGLFRRYILAKLGARLAAHAELRARERRKHAVARAVGKQRRVNLVKRLRGHLPASHRLNTRAVHLAAEAAAIHEQFDIRLAARHLIHYAVPYGVVVARIAVKVFQIKLLHQTGFAVVGAVRAAYPHAYLAGRIAAQHGAFLHNCHMCAVPRRRYRRAQTRKSAAHHAQIHVVTDGIESIIFYHVCHSSTLFRMRALRAARRSTIRLTRGRLYLCITTNVISNNPATNAVTPNIIRFSALSSHSSANSSVA